jgi:hypothetical protein
MKKRDLFLKVYGEESDGQWSLICLDFSLAAQAETLPEAQALLQSQIKEYLVDALHGEDKQYAHTLLYRRAPLKYWVKWWIAGVWKQLFGASVAKQQKSYREPIDLIPA